MPASTFPPGNASYSMAGRLHRAICFWIIIGISAAVWGLIVLAIEQL